MSGSKEAIGRKAYQKTFVERHEKLRNGLGADEAIVYGDAVHPPHQTRPAGIWMPRGADIAVPAASGRDRMTIHGVIDLETGATRMKEVLSIDAQSTIDLLTSIENVYATMRRINVFLHNARYHHARAVQDWMRQPGGRIVLHFIPSYCPHPQESPHSTKLQPVSELRLIVASPLRSAA